jgi:hypothetical protein
MSFIKSIVKEMNVAKSMLDIPALKHEREQLQVELSKCVDEIGIISEKIASLDIIYATSKSLKEISGICLNTDDQQTALRLSNQMCEFCDGLQNKLRELNKKRDDLIGDIESVNKKLKKARENVK